MPRLIRQTIYLLDVEDALVVVITEFTSLIMGALEHRFRVPGPLVGPSTSIAMD